MDDQAEQVDLLRQIVRWTREIALPTVRARVVGLLDSEPKKRVYEALALGNLSVSAIEKTTGVNHNTIREWLTRWNVEGIVETQNGLPRATFTLAELGLGPPLPKEPRPRKSAR